MKRYIGEILWFKVETVGLKKNIQSLTKGKIKRAILNDNIFKIDHNNPEGLPDSEIRLKSTDGLKFDGSAKYINSSKANALVNLEYYMNDKKAMLLGMWEEEQVEYLCTVKLSEVDSFKD